MHPLKCAFGLGNCAAVSKSKADLHPMVQLAAHATPKDRSCGILQGCTLMINKAISAYSKQSSIQVRARSSESYESPSYYETLAKACSQAILSAPTEALECAAPMRPIYETPQDTPYREELRRAVIPLAKRYVAIFETDLDSAAAKDRLESTIEFYSRNDALVARLEGLVEALSE